MNVLVVHGPNLNLLGEDRKDPCSYAQLNASLAGLARELGATLKVVQSNHEGVLIDAIQNERRWADAVLINPGALTHTSYSLREALRIVARPAVEVHLEDIRRRETWRRRSVIKDVCEAQVMGKGLLSYLDGLERLVTRAYAGVRKGKSRAAAWAANPSGAPAPAAKSLGPAAAAPAKPEPKPVQKSIGRSIPTADPLELLKQAASTPPAMKKESAKTIGRLNPPQSETGPKTIGRAPADKVTKVGAGVTRAAVREKIAARLQNAISAATLATWAREQWLNVERGTAAEMGHRELLAEALQSLALSATPAGNLNDNDLIELLTRLDA